MRSRNHLGVLPLTVLASLSMVMCAPSMDAANSDIPTGGSSDAQHGIEAFLPCDGSEPCEATSICTSDSTGATPYCRPLCTTDADCPRDRFPNIACSPLIDRSGQTASWKVCFEQIAYEVGPGGGIGSGSGGGSGGNAGGAEQCECNLKTIRECPDPLCIGGSPGSSCDDQPGSNCCFKGYPYFSKQQGCVATPYYPDTSSCKATCTGSSSGSGTPGGSSSGGNAGGASGGLCTSANGAVPGGQYNNCIQPFYDPSYYNWLAIRNTCNQPIHATWCENNSPTHCYAKDIPAGGKASTGSSQAEVDAVGGFEYAICGIGYHATGVSGAWKAGDGYCCRK